MRIRWEWVAIGALAAAIGCGGDATGLASVASGATNGSSNSGGSNGSTNGGTFKLADVVGNYSGTFKGSNTQLFTYTGTGTGSILADGAATFTYNAKTTGIEGIQFNRTFFGSVDASGNFSGITQNSPAGGGPPINYSASGTVTEVSNTQVNVQITWIFPYSNGGTFYTSTENWILNKQ